MELPFSGEQIVEAKDRMIGDAGDDVGEPSLRVDVVYRRGFDKRIQDRGAAAAGVGTREEVVLAASGRMARSAALLKGMVPETPLFRLAFMVREGHGWATGSGALGARNGGRPS